MPKRWRLDGQTALITGASRGIGWACAREFAELGANLLLVARDEDQLERAAVELGEEYGALRIETLSADLSEGEGRAAVMDWLVELRCELHILVNNVGNNLPRAALAYTDADLRQIFATNVSSAFELSRIAHRWLVQHANASIVNVASVSGLTHVRTGAAYGMSKAALVQMTRNLACEWATDGIRVNAVAPWYIRTQRSAAALSDPDYLEEVLSRTPAARIGEPEDVAAAITFLSLPCASYLTGECIAVDGGFLKYGF